MAADPTFIHIDKSVAIWAGQDGIPCIIYPDKPGAAISVKFEEQRIGTELIEYSASAVATDNILFYTRSISDDFNKDGTFGVVRTPCIYYDTDTGTTQIIKDAKFPKVFCTPHSDTIFLSYWTNLKDGAPGEPTKNDGTIDTGYSRALYMTTGVPKYMAYYPVADSDENIVFDTFYLFSKPIDILEPVQWDVAGTEEPVVDVTLGTGGSAMWLADP